MKIHTQSVNMYSEYSEFDLAKQSPYGIPEYPDASCTYSRVTLIQVTLITALTYTLIEVTLIEVCL